MSEHSNHDSGYGIYVTTWLSLLGLTAITVTVSGMALGKFSLLVAIAIAVVKATVVVLFFMHVRQEKPVFKYMILVTLATFGIFLGLTFFDAPFR